MDAAFVILVCTAGSTAGAWIAYLRWKDKRHPEPLTLMLAAVVAGAGSVGLGLLGYRALDALGASVSWGALMGELDEAIAIAFLIGAVEETAKLLPVFVIARWSRHFDELWDGFVYAGASAVGFGVAETFLLVAMGETGGTDALARAVAGPITHALFAAPWGLGVAGWLLGGRPWTFVVGMVTSIASHGLYNLFLARPGTHLAATAIVAALWLGVLWLGRDLVRRPRVPR